MKPGGLQSALTASTPGRGGSAAYLRGRASSGGGRSCLDPCGGFQVPPRAQRTALRGRTTEAPSSTGDKILSTTGLLSSPCQTSERVRARTRKKIHALLSAAWSTAVGDCLISENPARGFAGRRPPLAVVPLHAVSARLGHESPPSIHSVTSSTKRTGSQPLVRQTPLRHRRRRLAAD
jgi:hypothetical protein